MLKWTCACKPPHVTVREFLEQRFTVDDEHCSMRILDCVVFPDEGPTETAYVALEWIMKDTHRRQVLAVVFSVTRTRQGDGERICWREATESMLPPALDCPECILRLLTPTEDPCALHWRALCRQRRQRRQRRKERHRQPSRAQAGR